jgi:hypothetical protein
MRKNLRCLSKGGIILILLVSIAIFADDDDDEDDEHEDHKSGRYERLASARELSAIPQHANYKKECASCHMLYHPGLLPESSWKKMMGGLDKHFGENAELDSKARAEIEKFLVDHSADKSTSRRSSRLLENLGKNNTPLRITQTAYFIRKHDEINASVYKRPKIGSAANCVACHKNAETGVFSEREIKIPKL